MLNIIDLINMKDEIKKEEMFDFFKTNSSEINSEIYKKIQNSSKLADFCDYSSNRSNIFRLINLLKNTESYFSKVCNDKSFSSLKSKNEQYIFCISQLFLSIKFFLKVKDIINKILISSKKYLNKLRKENQIQNSHQNNLFSFIDNLLLFSKTKNSNFLPNVSTIINTLYSTKKTTQNLLKKFNYKSSNVLYNGSFTPRFSSKSDEDEENNQKKEKEQEIGFPIRTNSILTFSEFVFFNEQITPPSVLPEKELFCLKEEFSPLKPRRKPDSINLCSFKKINNENKNRVLLNITDKNNYKNLLEMINSLFKKCLINDKEKLKLKQLVLSNSQNIQYFFNNVYDNSNIPADVFIFELKKILH